MEECFLAAMALNLERIVDAIFSSLILIFCRKTWGAAEFFLLSTDPILDTTLISSVCNYFAVKQLNSVYTRSGQNGTPNSNATNLHSSQKRCCSFCISSSNASPTFQVQKSIFHQMTKPIQVTVILPLLLAISFSRNDDIHSSISGISNDLIGVIPTIGQ